MTMKRILTIVLLAFVVVSVGYLVAKEVWPRGKAAPAAAGVPATGRRIVVFFFYDNTSCGPCRKIEAYTEEAIRARFADALGDGRLLWRPINTDAPGYEHFTEDYQLATKSVVLAEFRDGRRVRWRNLDKVWDLLGDKAAFQAYVTDEAAAFGKEP